MKLIEEKNSGDIIEEGKEQFNQEEKGERVLPLNERLEIFLKICDAISYAHAQEVAHRRSQAREHHAGAFW